MINNDQLYLFSFISSPSVYYNYIPTVDKMIGSLSKYFKETSLTKVTSEIVKPVSENVKPLGNEDADITVIEFADYRCPFCDKFHQETFDKLVTNFINTGKAKYLFKDFVVNDRMNTKDLCKLQLQLTVQPNRTNIGNTQKRYTKISSLNLNTG